MPAIKYVYLQNFMLVGVSVIEILEFNQEEEHGKTVTIIINPRRACAARVTVVVLCVYLFVCPRLFSDYRLRGGL